MPRVHFNGIIQRKQLGFNAVDQNVIIAARQIGAANTSLKEDVARNDKPVFAAIKRNAAGGVAGSDESFNRPSE